MIKVANISKYFSKKCILDDVSFKIYNGEVTCLLGKNGTGKSTIINIISGLLRQDQGYLFIDNEKIQPSSFNYRKNFGYVFENSMLIDKLTSKEYLTMISEMYEIPKGEYLERIKSLLLFFELPYDGNKYIESYSLGMKVKTSLAAAMVHNPKYLILDEPFNGLDIVSTNNLINLLRTFIKKNKAIFITSHNLDLVIDLCDRFLVLDNGRIIMDIQKSDYPNVGNLKIAITERITDSSIVKKLSWLS